MKATADLQIIPIGFDVSVRKQITQVVKLLKQEGLHIKPHASGTNIEGDLDQILTVVKKIHELLHQEGVVRLLSNVKIETRTDKVPSLAAKEL